MTRPISKNTNAGASIHRRVPEIKRRLAEIKSVFIFTVSRKKAEDGIIIARARRYPVVHHCTISVLISNSLMRVGKETFMDVSTIIPIRARSAVDIIESISLKSSFLSNSKLFSIKAIIKNNRASFKQKWGERLWA